MRNIGSSVGTSLVTTLIARRSQSHQLRLVEKARVNNPNFANAIQSFAGLGRHGSLATAYARIYHSFNIGLREYLH